MKIRDRIWELRRVTAPDLVPHPGNWRVHGKTQAAALKGLLAEIGYADALLARELPDGKLLLIDGHLPIRSWDLAVRWSLHTTRSRRLRRGSTLATSQ
jgi:hypothetical protein